MKDLLCTKSSTGSPGLLVLPFTFLLLSLASCGDGKKDTKGTPSPPATSQIEAEMPKKHLSQEFKTYWYAGDAEITSYELQQERYGELREGKAVLIFVTEPFLPAAQVKADRDHGDNIPVLKLNATKKFLTGIYPYSIMGSTFYPVHDNGHALKTSLSVQEWCGHVYSQINNREKFEFTSHSYFEGEADQRVLLEKAHLENGLWTKIRIDPQGLPLGQLEVVPSLESLRLYHREAKAYRAEAALSTSDGISTYTLSYPDLGRSLGILFTADFPHTIEGWWEETTQGNGEGGGTLRSTATKIKNLKTAYWGQNSNQDLHLRDLLGL